MNKDEVRKCKFTHFVQSCMHLMISAHLYFLIKIIQLELLPVKRVSY